MAPPFRQIEFDIMYGQGISKMGELLDLGVAGGVVDKSGAWFSYDGTRIGQGRENSKNFLREHPAMAEKLEKQIRANAGLIADDMLTGPADAEEAADAALESPIDAQTEDAPKGKK
jgi:recombination protein RecA